jgi:uncharacterized protein
VGEVRIPFVWQARTMSTTTEVRPSGSGITVTGEGRAGEAPDVVVLTVGAEATSSRVAEATGRAGTALARMRDAVVAEGIGPEQLTTRAFSLRPGYDREGRPSGAVCELGLEIRSRAVSRAGELAAACVEAGGEEARLQGVTFEHSDPTRLLARARELAFADAARRAAQFATLAGRELGAVQEITEGRPAAVPMGGDLMAKAMSAREIPVDGGSVDVVVSVTVRWAWA